MRNYILYDEKYFILYLDFQMSYFIFMIYDKKLKIKNVKNVWYVHITLNSSYINHTIIYISYYTNLTNLFFQ